MPTVHRIGVISDTHIPKKGPRVPDAALRHFEDVELILHAGDLSSLAVLDQLSAYAPVEAVQGNIELPDVGAALPIKRELVVGGCVIGLIHILGDRAHHARNARAEFPAARVSSSSATPTSPIPKTPMACCCSTAAAPPTAAPSPPAPLLCSLSQTASRTLRSSRCESAQLVAPLDRICP